MSSHCLFRFSVLNVKALVKYNTQCCSVTDRGSYNTANIAHKYISNRSQFQRDTTGSGACVILVGNKNDLWQDREVATDFACQVGGGQTVIKIGMLTNSNIIFTLSR